MDIKEKLKAIPYVNLVNHTHFSIPMGVGNIKAHIKRAKQCGFKGFAITDSHMMGGVLEAYKLRDEKFPVAIGVQLNVIDDLERKDKTNKYFTLTCFAKNAQGYKNLVTLTSIGSQDDHFYFKPRISLIELIQHSEGLVVLSGDMNGMLAQSILKETGQEEMLMQIFKEHFGDDFYLEMHFYNMKMQWDKDTKTHKMLEEDPQKTVNLRLNQLAKKFDVKQILVQNAFFPEPKHKLLQSILIGNTPAGKDGWHPFESFHTRPLDEVYDYIQEKSNYITDEQLVEWSENSMHAFNKLKDIKLSFTPRLPKIQYQESLVNQGTEWDDKFKEVKADLKTRHPKMHELFEVAEKDISLKTSLKIMIKNAKVDFKNKIHLDRLDEELRVIQRNGIIRLCDYFLLLEDVTHFVRTNGFLRGFGRGCLTADAPVLTTKGFKALEDIQEGDMVYTHSGKAKKVVKTFVYDVKEKLLEVETANSWGTITLTKDHKVLGIKRKKEKNVSKKTRKYQTFVHSPDFHAISEFSEGDLLFVKKPKYSPYKMKTIDLAKFITHEKNYIIKKNKIERLNPLTGNIVSEQARYIEPSDQFIYLLGKWVGDGWYRFSEKKRNYELGYAFNSEDVAEIQKTKTYFESLGFEVKETPSKKKKLVQLHIYNKLLVLWFKNFFKEYKRTSATKYLGPLKKLPLRQLNILLKGYQSADGSISDSKHRQETVSTTSLQLVKDLKEAFMYANIPVNISERKPYYRGKYLCKKSYTLKFIGLSRERKARSYMIEKDGYYVKIKSLKEVAANKVYDLMIGGEPSYSTANFTVHNSGAGSLVAYALDITDCDPIHFDLLFERFLTKERIGKLNFEMPGFPMSKETK